MALLKSKLSEIPKDAVLLSEEEALSYQLKVLNNWKKPGDIFAYKYGSFVLGAATVMTGMYFNSHFRSKYKLFNHGRISSYLPICIVPATFSFIFHFHLVLRDVILLKQNICPACIEMRSCAIQAFSGCVFPLIMAPVSSVALAHRYVTYDMPYITKEPRKVLEVLKKQISPIKNIIFAIFIGHAILASVVTHFEAKSIFTVNQRLAKLEYELEHGTYVSKD